jgi:hypothetical protein
MKTYSLVIVYNDNDDVIEYIEEEITDDHPNLLEEIGSDPDKFDDDTLKNILLNGYIIGES